MCSGVGSIASSGYHCVSLAFSRDHNCTPPTLTTPWSISICASSKIQIWTRQHAHQASCITRQGWPRDLTAGLLQISKLLSIHSSLRMLWSLSSKGSPLLPPPWHWKPHRWDWHNTRPLVDTAMQQELRHPITSSNKNAFCTRGWSDKHWWQSFAHRGWDSAHVRPSGSAWAAMSCGSFLSLSHGSENTMLVVVILWLVWVVFCWFWEVLARRPLSANQQ